MPKNLSSPKPWPWLFLSAIVILLDQISKYWVSNTIVLGQFIKVLPFLNITLSYNEGAAFSFLGKAGGWQTYFLILVSLVASIVLFLWLMSLSRKQVWTLFCIALILGGALGNLIDRTIFGYVRDFIDFHISTWHFATFNLADSCICIGVVLFLLKLITDPLRTQKLY